MSLLAHSCATLWLRDDIGGSGWETFVNKGGEKLALNYKEAAALVGVEYRTIKAGVERGSIPSVRLGQRNLIPRAGLLRVFGIEPQLEHVNG